jgi:hypothetical protein
MQTAMVTAMNREAAGTLAGVLAAPFIALVSLLRGERMFHPDGLVFRARVAPHPRCPAEFRGVAERLGGPALARFSGALWRRGFEHLDVLGIALRLLSGDGASPEDVDQDILFATIRSPLTMALSPLTTDAGDYFANRYWAVSPFDVGLDRHVKLRLVGTRQAARKHGQGREPRLRRAVAAGEAIWQLEARRVFAPTYRPLATVTLESESDLDQSALRFSPFHDARGIIPRGLVHAMRKPAYAASQLGRAVRSR